MGNFIHGMAQGGTIHPIYTAWLNIKNRCSRTSGKNSNYYLKKGVLVCKEWVNDFNSFYNWAINNGWKDGLTIDRYPNKNGNYEPDNCRWATDAQQNRNKNNNIVITAFGETKCVQDWVKDERCKVSFNTIRYRMRNNWNLEEAIVTPSTNKVGNREKRKNTIIVDYKNDKKTLHEWCSILGLDYLLIRNRLYKGWDIAEAFETKKLKYYNKAS